MTKKFHNPYNFIPTPPRDNVTGPLGDAGNISNLPGHDRYRDDHYSGKITVRLTTASPLLMVDGAKSELLGNDHKVFEIMKDSAGNPFIPETSLRGTLRTAFEAATNSRFGIFSKFDENLYYWAGYKNKQYYNSSPSELLHESIRPATSYAEMSPADRVFGFVNCDMNSKTNAAYKSHISFGQGYCQTDKTSAIKKIISKKHKYGIPLSNLAEPKLKYGLFYVAEDKQGSPQGNGLNKKKAGYDSPLIKSLRGRKVYPHHKYLKNYPEYWTDPHNNKAEPLNKNRKSSRIYREYVRRGGDKARDNQNRSITDWVNPETEFTFNIYLDNISKCDLGALLWVLNPGQGQDAGQDKETYYHRFGGGKPLGFGSATLNIDDIDLRTGTMIKQDYLTLSRNKVEFNIDETINCYKDSVLQAYGGDNKTSFDNIPFIQAIKNGMKGIGDPQSPIHYPRLSEEHIANPKNYEWFGNNGPQEALPALYSNNTSLSLGKKNSHNGRQRHRKR